MRIEMLVRRELQEAGRELVLNKGEAYEVSQVVGEALIATRAATAIRPEAVVADAEPAAPLRSPERAVTAPASSRTRRRTEPDAGS